ncbi:MAG TPA: hypothetical protein VMO75_02095 [Chthoniobacterales bacterium]|nr:hypothetical protein [Chthoniobacterales bacterium]
MFQIVAAIATGILTLLATVWGLRHGAQKSGSGSLGKIFWLIPAAGLVAIIAQTLAAVAHHNYNSELLPRYDQEFEELSEDRAKAASAIHTYLRLRDWDAVTDSDLDGLENVLDFFDDIGFEWRHGLISGPLLHQHFYYYLRLYCQQGSSYITAVRASDAPTTWENVIPLFNELTRIEAKKLHCDPAKCSWDTESLEESLQVEMRLNPKGASVHRPQRR